MSLSYKKISKSWRDVKATAGFRKMLTFLIFVAIATLFWLILALNDSVQDDFEVKLKFDNVPDSVTFLTVPPEEIHVSVRDQGSSLWRNGLFRTPTLHINFKDYAKEGQLRYSKSELNAGLKQIFGGSASMISTSIDSLNLNYTTLPGKRIPVDVSSDITTAAGKVIYGKPIAIPQNVLVFSTRNVLDTITRIFTEKITQKNLEETTEISVKLRNIPGVRLEPAIVKVKINVETLVQKKATVNVKIHNIPPGLDILLFPSNVVVEYFVPMSNFNRSDYLPEVNVDYRDLQAGSNRLPLHIGSKSSEMFNIKLLTDSVEYTLVKN